MTKRPAPADVLKDLWSGAGMAPDALERASLTGTDPVLPSSFAVGTAAQTSIAAAALAATEIGRLRNGLVQGVAVAMVHAALECRGYFKIDGRVPEQWDKLSGLYRCRYGWVRIHANFAHHRDGALRLLGLAEGKGTERPAVEAALLTRGALEFESAAAQAGLVVAALRTFEEWDLLAHAAAVAAQPLITFERIGDAPPRVLPPLPAQALPLSGLRVLDLTRILAGPIGGRTLAAYGADVLLVNSPNLPNIESIIETSRGKLSCHVDLTTDGGRAALRSLLEDAHVFVQGYRPGGIAAQGFGAEGVARLRPGIVYVSLSAYGHTGPWAGRRGFDSLVQAATGFNLAEAAAAGSDQPRALPMQILDYATGYLIAFAAQAALLRQAREGGSWHARVSLVRTGRWIRDLERVENAFAVPVPSIPGSMETTASGWGELLASRHAAQLSQTPVAWARPSVKPGTHPPRWPG